MRRSTAVLMTLAVIASILSVGSLSYAAVAPATIAPGDTPDIGSFYVAPEPVAEGESVKLTANFPDGTFTVTFFKKVSDTEWNSIGTDVSNSSGNAYLTNYKVNGTQDLYARITSGGPAGRTEVHTITPTPAPVISPSGPDVASLYENPTTYAAGDTISLTANFASGTFPITLYKEGPADTWTSVATKTSNSSGNATFTGFPVTTASQRVFARKTNNDRTEVDVIAPSPNVDLHILRDCTGNNCGGTATATGKLDPVQAGREFTLQRLSGSSWVTVSGADPASTGADGKVSIQFPLDGIPQWSVRKYRLTSAEDANNPAVTSREIQFMPGPTQLGSNVLRVDVDKGAYPTSKANEYTGKATLSKDGNVFLDHVALEKFGVRGTSTAGYTKKPYKLKFDKSPKNTTVFGMGADKSWTLLASYLDQTFVRDKVGLDLGRRIAGPIPWTPDSRFVELFVNDQYRGSYLMTESVKIDGDRVNVDPETGMEMEVDNAVGSGSIGFTSSKGVPIVFKDPDERKTLDDGSVDPEGVTTGKLNAVKARVNAMESKLYSSTSSTRAQFRDYLDQDAAIDFQFIKEFTKDNDGDFNSSHYFAWDPVVDPLRPLSDNKFHFGPAWDFDRSAGNVDPDTAGHKYMSSPSGWILRGTGTPSDSGRQLYKTHWFVQMFKDSAFNAAVKARWLQIRDEFKKVGDSEVAKLKTEIGVGAQNDRNRWASEPKRYRSHGSYDGEISFVTGWYQDRYNWMNGQLTN